MTQPPSDRPTPPPPRDPTGPSLPSTSAPSAPGSYPTPPPKAARTGCLVLGLTTLFRLLLLGVGVTFAWLLGVGLAAALQPSSDRVPLQEVTLRRASRVLSEIRYLPSRWQQPAQTETRIEPVPIPTDPIAPLSEPAPELNATDRQVAQEEVDAIAADLRSLDRRLVDLETRLGRPQSTADPESRLDALRTVLEPDPDSASDGGSGPDSGPDSGSDGGSGPDSTPKPESIPAPDGPATPDPLFIPTELKVTLPSDALFAPGEARLLETAPALLSTILSDLQRYPDATLLVGSHTDDRSDAAISRELAFQQANALQRYLAQVLGDRRWVTIGYGQSQPISDNTTPEGRQRNRRIEILVDRR